MQTTHSGYVTITVFPLQQRLHGSASMLRYTYTACLVYLFLRRLFLATRDSTMFFFWRDSPQWARASLFTRFLDHTKLRITVGRIPLDERSGRRRDLYLTTHNTHSILTSMPPVVFEPTISTGEWPQTYALDRAAAGTGLVKRQIR